MEDHESGISSQPDEEAVANELNPQTDFVALDPSADAWDDAALIDAFNRAIASHRRKGEKGKKPNQVAKARKRVPPKVQAQPAVSQPKTSVPDPLQTTPAAAPATTPARAPRETLSFPPPPPPPNSSADLKDLLAAWYEAGYRAGFYVAREESNAR